MTLILGPLGGRGDKVTTTENVSSIFIGNDGGLESTVEIHEVHVAAF